MPVQHLPPPAPVVRTSLQTRIVSQTVILTAFVVVVLTTLSFWIARAILQQSVESQMRSLSFVAEDSLGRTLLSYRERTSVTAVRRDVQTVLHTGTADMTTLFRQLQEEEPALRGMVLVSEAGRISGAMGETEGLLREDDRQSHIIPRVTDHGWEHTDIMVPVRIDGRIAGALALRFSMADALRPLLSVLPALGKTATLLFFFEEEETIRFVYPALQPEDAFSLSLSSTEILPAFHALTAKGGVGRMENEQGRDALVAYRPLSLLNWGMALEVERKDVLSAVRRLALAHAAGGTMLLVAAGALALLLARQVTDPLRRLTATVRHLGPGHWTVRKTIQTDDEVGVLERVFCDLSVRLRRLYDHLEEEIADRTEALKKQYAMDRAILTHIAHGIVTVDTQGHITGANPAAAALLGLSEETLQGQAIMDHIVLREPGGERSGEEHPVLQALQKRTLIRSKPGVPETIRRADGSLLPVTYVASPLLQGRRVFGAIIVLQDVSEERKLEERKSEFVTLASHQLRTPLSTVRWYVELLSDDRQTLTIEQREYLAEMQRGTDRMLALLTTLLHASQYEGNGIQPTLSSIDICDFARQRFAENRELAQEARVRCTLVVPDTPLMILSDPVHLQIVFQNILSNAVKYASFSTERRVTLSVTAADDSVLIRIADTGIGIPRKDQKRIFERFFRAENVRKIDTDGNGLGLSICKSIVERLGGTIAFTSRENAGTTFTVTLPRKKTTPFGKKTSGKRKKDR